MCTAIRMAKKKNPKNNPNPHILVRTWRDWITHIVLVEHKMVQPTPPGVSFTMKHVATIGPSYCILGHLLQRRENLVYTKTYTQMSIAAVFVTPPNLKEPRCPSKCEWLSRHGVLLSNRKTDTHKSLDSSLTIC